MTLPEPAEERWPLTAVPDDARLEPAHDDPARSMSPEDQPPVRVLYVGGWGRSGSTLLDRILGQVPGVFSAGELRQIWLKGLAENRPCGCGRDFRDCPFWSRVGNEAFGGWSNVDLESVLRFRATLDRGWSAPLLLARRTLPRHDARVRHYEGLLGRLYAAIRSVSGCEVIVDSSKLPSHAFLLRRTPGLDLRLVHLVRDSRGVAYSWQKRGMAKSPSIDRPEYLLTYGPIEASIRWTIYNGLVRAAGSAGVPYLFVRYEDLVERAKETIDDVLEHAGIHAPAETLSFLRDERVLLRENHTVGGNPMRFSVGELPLRLDEEWRTNMRPADRRWVTLLTSPVLARYGYPLGSGERAARRKRGR